MKLLALATLATLAACTPAQQQAAIVIAANALPCYEAVRAATHQTDTAANTLNGAVVMASYPACVGVDAATADLIASAVMAKAPVAAAPVAGKPAG